MGLRWIFALALVAVIAPAAMAKEVFRDLQPSSVASDLAPGLAVTYWRDIKFDRMVEMREIIQAVAGETGAPVARLATGPRVLSTDGTQFVAAVMTGAIHFDAAGTYDLSFVSNDGILVAIDGQVVYADPNRHADSASGPIAVEIDTPGWFDLDIAYFQKKGTHRHDMFWRRPGDDGPLTLVPAAAFGHVAGSVPGFATMPVPDPADTAIR